MVREYLGINNTVDRPEPTELLACETTPIVTNYDTAWVVHVLLWKLKRFDGGMWACVVANLTISTSIHFEKHLQ